MKKETQASPVSWRIIPKENQHRIVNLLGQLVCRQVEVSVKGGATTNEQGTSKSDIDKSLQRWENSKPLSIRFLSGVKFADYLEHLRKLFNLFGEMNLKKSLRSFKVGFLRHKQKGLNKKQAGAAIRTTPASLFRAFYSMPSASGYPLSGFLPRIS